MNINENIEKIINEEYAGLPAIKDSSMQNAVRTVINNTLKVISEDAPATVSGAMDQYTPVVISLIRRTLPTLVGPQMIGMQAMNLPTGRIFVQRVYAIDRLHNTTYEVWGGTGEPGMGNDKDQPFSRNAATSVPLYRADGGHTGGYASYDASVEESIPTDCGAGQAGYPNYGAVDANGVAVNATGMRTHDGEQLGWKVYGRDKNFTIAPYPEMSFGIDSMDVFTKTRKLKGRITQEVIQDLRAVHGMDAEAELANILQAEITSEIDREIVTRIVYEARLGARTTSNPGVFSFADDADGRWSMEKVMSLLIQIEREATIIAQETRRGRGNFVLTTPEIAAYLSMANLITFIQNTGFTPIVNPVGTSYYGMLANRFKVFVDPYLVAQTATGDTGDVENAHVVVVGYKGTSVYDAGLFYCPYVPIQWWRAIGEEDGGQRLGIMSRYGLVSNPYTLSAPIGAWRGNQQGTSAGANANAYFRKFYVVLDGSFSCGCH